MGCLRPIAALILFLLVFLAWPVERHKDASDFHTAMFFLTLALVPIAVLAAIVLAIMAVVRARRERAGGVMFDNTGNRDPERNHMLRPAGAGDLGGADGARGLPLNQS